MAVLDETDSGLDIDALKVVAAGVQEPSSPQMGALVITHYQRILNYVTPDFVHVFVDGRIVKERERARASRASWGPHHLLHDTPIYEDVDEIGRHVVEVRW